MAPSAYKKTNGFTLIEVLIALAICAIAFVAVLQSIQTDIKIQTRLQQESAARLLAESLIAQIKGGLKHVPLERPLEGQKVVMKQSLIWTAQAQRSKTPFLQEITVTIKDPVMERSIKQIHETIFPVQ